jgi:hypothetical protein
MSVEVTLHKLPGLPETPIEIHALGWRGVGSDHSHYVIGGMNMLDNPQVSDARIGDHERLDILFQNGPIPQVGHNGVTIEHLLAVCGHRLEELQSGKFASEYNQKALEHIQGAIASLSQRTLDRIARQVEGTYQT